MSSLEDHTTGKWLISVHKHLEDFSSSPELTYFDSTVRAAQCGRFLALIRKKEFISSERELIGMARGIQVAPLDLKRIILPELERRGLIIVDRSQDDEVTQVREFAPSEQEILEETANIWESFGPQDEERITVHALELCSILPMGKGSLEARLEQMGFRHEQISTSLSLQRAFELVKEERFPGDRESTFYNEYIFRENIERVVRYLRRLDVVGRQTLEQLIKQIRLKQGLPLDDLQGIPNPMLHAARTTGLLDVTRIRTTTGGEQLFAFTPHFYTFGARQDDLIQDTWDEVKLFVANIVYGNRFAPVSTGRIQDPIVLVEALLRNKEIGPATAIGRDYPLLETHGIIQTRPSRMHSSRYYMQLVKDDVVKRGLQVLKYGSEGAIASGFKQNPSGLYVPGRFFSPEQDRLLLEPTLGKQAAAVKEVQQQLLRAWRGEDF
jgi:hypothetical protein